MYESQLKIIKESDVCDERQHCLLFTSIGSVVKYLSVETRQELLKMESSWNTALCSAVRRLKVNLEFIKLFYLPALVNSWTFGLNALEIKIWTSIIGYNILNKKLKPVSLSQPFLRNAFIFIFFILLQYFMNNIPNFWLTKFY